MTDEQMMISVQNGNHSAFKLIVEKYLEISSRIALRLINNRAIAEEVVQDSFLKVWEKAQLWDEKKASFKTWFYRILRNKCIDYLRKKRESFLDVDIDIIDETQYSDDNFFKKEEAKIVQQEITALKEVQKTAIILFYYENFKIKEIAKILNKKEKAVESLLFRAKTKLKKSFKKYGI